MTDSAALDERVAEIYRTALDPLARTLAFEMPLRPSRSPRRPTVLFLGNHSSGKSSFINHLLGSAQQKTGLAPMDDGFTILTHGEEPDSLDGPTVATHPRLACRDLEQLGPAFLSRLRLRALPSPILEELDLIDSPGMIDSSAGSPGRDYDFERSLRAFAERSDLILFLFDPGKPGTTAETVDSFTRTLAGLEHKLLILMNKADQLSSMRDFARSYGALCWNLSKAIPTKDMPHIYTTYLPGQPPSPSSIPLEDFDRAREEIEREIRGAPARRDDNLVTDLVQNARRLWIHARVCGQIGRGWARLALCWNGLALSLLALVLLGGLLFWEQLSGGNRALLALAGAVLPVLAFLAGLFLQRRLKASLQRPEELDRHFSLAFHRELALGERTDLQASWQGQRPFLAKALEVLPMARLSLAWIRRRRVRRLEEALEGAIPELRRSIGQGSAPPAAP